MSDKIVNLARARTTREFLDKYGELPVSGLSLVAAIASAREACGKSIQAVEERLGETPRPKTVRQVVALAARKGDAEARLLLESGVLEIMTD